MKYLSNKELVILILTWVSEAASGCLYQQYINTLMDITSALIVRRGRMDQQVTSRICVHLKIRFAVQAFEAYFAYKAINI